VPRVLIDDLVVDYIEAGAGVPIIFIPGITEFKEAFGFQFRGLSDKYRIISYDVRRGLKKSAEYTLDLLTSDLHKFMDALKITDAVICGHSFGALIAMQFAIEHPEATDALILISAFHSAPEVSQDRFLNWISSSAHPLRRILSATFQIQVSKLFGGAGRRTPGIQDAVAAVGKQSSRRLKTSRATIAQRLRIIQKADLRPVLPQIQAPTLVVVGSRDRAFFLKSAQEIYEAIPNASLEVIEGGAHLCFLTHHDQFNALIDEFLTEHLPEIA
jgi:pimeloyl-ACP methyl ester carboxylesterase